MGRVEARMFVAGWRPLWVGAGEMRDFVELTRLQQGLRAVFITPGEFSPEARQLAEWARVETVDGETFLRTLSDLPVAEQERLLRVLTAGQFTVPSCPVCGSKMVVRNGALPEFSAAAEDLDVRRSMTFPDEVRCSRLTVRGGVDAQFLHAVHADTMLVEGRATGAFAVNGPVTIRRGACLSGLVAARAIHVDDGGLLDGEASIIGEKSAVPELRLPPRPVWGCPRYPACCGVLELHRS